MKFAGSIIFVPDVEAAVSFYERAFDVARKFVDDSGQYGEILSDGARLGFVRYDLANSNVACGYVRNDPNEQPAGIEIWFEAENLDSAYQKAIDAGAVGVLPPTVKPWGQSICYVRDLNGVLVEIGTPMD